MSGLTFTGCRFFVIALADKNATNTSSFDGANPWRRRFIETSPLALEPVPTHVKVHYLLNC